MERSKMADKLKPTVEPAQALALEPRTPLGRWLALIRARIVASGEPLLDWDAIEREVLEHRGGSKGDLLEEDVC